MHSPIHVQVDHTRCVGSTICTQLAPKVFALDEKGQAAVVNLDGENEARIQEAADGCPVSAIVIENAETGKRLFP